MGLVGCVTSTPLVVLNEVSQKLCGIIGETCLLPEGPTRETVVEENDGNAAATSIPLPLSYIFRIGFICRYL